MARRGLVERGYTDLLAHLQQIKPKVPSETLQAAITYHLVHLPATQPTPTPLTASIIASPVWHPLSFSCCLALGSAFRAAIRQKLVELNKEKRGLFEPSTSRELATWVRGISAGLRNGDPILRLSISGGLLLGIRDIEEINTNQRLARDVEETTVLAFAEVAEASSTLTADQWANEFKNSDINLTERMELSVLLAAQYFNSISSEALSALDLLSLASSCLNIVDKTFMSGYYLRTARESLLRDTQRTLIVSPHQTLEDVINTVSASECFTCAASMRKELWKLLNDVSQKLYQISYRVEQDWHLSPLAELLSENQLEQRISDLTGKIWTILKTQLFSTLMLQQAILDTILFVAPPQPSSLISSNTYSPSDFASAILETLCSLSFVIASFGGVTAGASGHHTGPSFPELKKVFYMSIDILSADKQESEVFVRRLVRDTDAYSSPESPVNPFVNGKRSFVLHCTEQFISVLDDACIEEVVLPFCEPHLGNPSNRETFESAHSVMLSIFAAHAEKSSTSSSHFEKGDLKGKGVEQTNDIGLARRLVPGYAQSLLENAKKGGLTTPQLRLAYAALVRSASTGKNPRTPSETPSVARKSNSPYAWWRTISGPNTYEEFTGDPALAWLCVEQLLEAISHATNANDQLTRFALSLTLVSLISNVNLVLLPRILDEVERVVDVEADGERRKVLIENVFEEILEKVGDTEREHAMEWWFGCARKWVTSSDTEFHEQKSL